MQRFTCWVILLALLAGCSRTTETLPTADLYVFRTEPPALVELSPDGQVAQEIPIAIPGGCTLGNVFAPPVGSTAAIEFNCEFGPAVLYVNAANGAVRQPVTDSDSHFMAWTPDGQEAYLKVDTVNRPHIVRASLRGKPRYAPLTELTYDISPRPASSDLLFSVSRGMGQGSEMWYAWDGGRATKLLLSDPGSYLSLAHWSPDGSRISFIKIPDSSTPFTTGELWVMNADGSGARKLAAADAGHGFAPAWSPDGTRIAFVVRDNPNDPAADQSAAALKSHIAIVKVADGTESQPVRIPDVHVEAPAWSPDGNRLAFTGVLNDKMHVYIADIESGKIQQALTAPACCPAWIRQ